AAEATCEFHLRALRATVSSICEAARPCGFHFLRPEGHTGFICEALEGVLRYIELRPRGRNEFH
ncbi:hypothetical protein HAX54_017328, partial [Datura stramonium]|nr:hypothetical protein [Datura stramonium]